MEHVKREVAKPHWDNFHGKKRKGRMGLDSQRLNKVAAVHDILDPTRCQSAMKRYDLAYVNGENTFMHKPEGVEHGSYPIHMELNDWAKNELGSFCESLFEEHEDELTELLMQEADEVKREDITTEVCKNRLSLCVPPPPPPPPKKKKKEKPPTRKQALKKARAAFDSFDTDSDGWLTRSEMTDGIQARRQSGEGGGGGESEKTVEEEVDGFFKQIDKDNNDKVNFYEYKFLWVKSKKQMEEDDDDAAGLLSAWAAIDPAELWHKAREVTATSPYAVLSGVGITTAAVYVGGLAARVW